MKLPHCKSQTDDGPASSSWKIPPDKWRWSFSRYGFLDLDFVSSVQLLATGDSIRGSVLRDLGFIRTNRFGKRSGRLRNEWSYLDVLAERIQEDKCRLRLFLTGESTADAMKRILEHFRERARSDNRASIESASFRLDAAVSRLADNVDQRLPMTFTIKDACLTNSSAIWLASHGYF